MIDDTNLEVEDELEEEESPQFHFTSKFTLSDSNLKAYEEFEGKLELYEKKLIIYESTSSPLEIKYEEITNITRDDYQVKVELESGDIITMYELGYDFEDFLNSLSKLHNEFLINHILMNDVKVIEFYGEYIHLLKSNSKEGPFECKIIIYNKSLIITSLENGPVRIPFSLISGIAKEDYQLKIDTDYDERFILRGLGGELDNLESHFNGALSRFSASIQEFLKKIMPQTNSLIVRKGSNLLKDGRAVKLEEIKTAAPQVLKAMEDRISECNSKDRYQFINSISHKGLFHIGLKKSLMGGLDSDFIWAISPILRPGGSNPGNVIMLEVLAPEKEGKATYFFRAMPWLEYSTMSKEEISLRINNIIKLINKCLIFIDFKREPIYMPEDKLEDPDNIKYKISLSRLPSLKHLRELYIGRVVHSSFEQWKRNVNSLINAAYNERNDKMRWRS